MISSRRPLLRAALFLLLLVATSLPHLARSASEDNPKAATAAMTTWLAGIDAGDYAASWRDASAAFRKAVTESQWIGALETVRKPLGSLKSRDLKSAVEQGGVPQPDGQMLKGTFVIAQFRTSFEKLPAAIETVTFEREADGVWRASGYFIKPE